MRTRSIFCGLVGAGLLAAAAPPQGHTVSPAGIKAQLESDPAMGETFQALKDDYPDEYERMVRLMVEGVGANRSDAEMRQLGFDEMRRFVGSKLPVLVRAPSADLRAVALAYADVIHVLQRDDQGLCARFVTTGIRASDIFSPAAMKALSHVNALQLRAMRHAETSPGPARGQLQQADAAAFTAAVARSNPAAMPLLQDQAKLNASSDADKCAVGVAIYDAISSLPEDQAAALAAALAINAPKGS
ncbi:MAG TPA: hypothetical protein VFW19_01645 [Allosphingosinicella sp.]|nr:hypothetical protein [Allosphingosinicella sp.]